MNEVDQTALSQAQQQQLWHWVIDFNNEYVLRLKTTLMSEFAFTETPAPVSDLLKRLEQLMGQMRNAVPKGEGSAWQIDNAHLPLLKAIILQYRREHVRKIQAILENTASPEVRDNLDKTILAADMFQSLEWFKQTNAETIPRLTDYVTLKRAEEILALQAPSYGKKPNQPPKRMYDDKFRILFPASSVAPELHYWRTKCELREVGLALAYVDIDNFKTEFNTPYTEVVIDRNFLPVFMRVIEAHTFCHGYAYREGGDEFIILVPNTSIANVIAFMDELRSKLRDANYPGIKPKPTVSVGICHVGPGCPLTDVELREKANLAKKYAKDKDHGNKNCIVSYKGDEFTWDELRIVKPQERAEQG